MEEVGVRGRRHLRRGRQGEHRVLALRAHAPRPRRRRPRPGLVPQRRPPRHSLSRQYRHRLERGEAPGGTGNEIYTI